MTAIPPKPVSLTVRYFAELREQAGCGQERLTTDSQTAGELYVSLQAQHGFVLEQHQLRFAVDGEFADSETSLSGVREVAFLPPMAGG